MNIPRIKDRLKKLYKKYIYSTMLYNVDLDKKYPKTKKALLIYSNFATRQYLATGREPEIAKTHSGFWESIQLVRSLNKFGYKVDYINYDEEYFTDYTKYQLILDIADHLKNIPEGARKKIIKIYYATSCHWLYFRESELRRVRSFYERENILICPERSVKIFSSERYADFITTFGGSFIKSTYLQSPDKFHDLDISVSYEPNLAELPKKNHHKFVWMGGYGPLHKGLDLTIAAFEKLPGSTLHVIGDTGKDEWMNNWLKKKTTENKNIVIHGFMNVTSKEFHDLVVDAVGNIFPSSSEGGSGSVAQLLHFGLIPVQTESACALRDESCGYKISTEDPLQIIDEIIRIVKDINNAPEGLIATKVKSCITQARRVHTKEAYKNSVETFLKKINA